MKVKKLLHSWWGVWSSYKGLTVTLLVDTTEVLWIEVGQQARGDCRKYYWMSLRGFWEHKLEGTQESNIKDILHTLEEVSGNSAASPFPLSNVTYLDSNCVWTRALAVSIHECLQPAFLKYSSLWWGWRTFKTSKYEGKDLSWTSVSRFG